MGAWPVPRDGVVPLPDVLKQLVDVVALERVQACCDVVVLWPGRTDQSEPRSCGPEPLPHSPPQCTYTPPPPAGMGCKDNGLNTQCCWLTVKTRKATGLHALTGWVRESVNEPSVE